MKSIFIKASKAADKLRGYLNLDMFEPLNIYDACAKIGVNVHFVDVNMEGMYVSTKNRSDSYIMLSNMRPLVRQVFTCSHEIGHHIFKHGSRINKLEKTKGYNAGQINEEFLVDTFAGYLLMPIAGIQTQFNKRNWNPYTALPIQYYLISSYFGIGYQTLIYHCRANKIINFPKAEELLKFTPSKLFKTYLSNNSLKISHFKIFDKYINNTTIELEVSNYLLLPQRLNLLDKKVELVSETKLGNLYRMIEPGVILIDSVTIKIQKNNYVGLSVYRHLTSKIII